MAATLSSSGRPYPVIHPSTDARAKSRPSTLHVDYDSDRTNGASRDDSPASARADSATGRPVARIPSSLPESDVDSLRRHADIWLHCHGSQESKSHGGTESVAANSRGRFHAKSPSMNSRSARAIIVLMRCNNISCHSSIVNGRVLPSFS